MWTCGIMLVKHGKIKVTFSRKKLLTDALRLHCLDFAITSFFSTRLTSCGTGWHLWRERKKVLCRSFFPVFNENDSTQINKLKSCTLNCIWSTLLHFFEETPIQKVLFHATNLWNFSRLLLHYLLLNMMLVEFKKKNFYTRHNIMVEDIFSLINFPSVLCSLQRLLKPWNPTLNIQNFWINHLRMFWKWTSFRNI